jgi:chemotaxis protein histidine kinase CheA
MAQARNGRTRIERFADHDIITPVNKLEKAIAKVVLPDDDPLARAQAALAQLSDEFDDWMTSECERLDEARCTVKEHGFAKRNLDELFFAAHDVKGGAATFGFPLAAAAAESLCRMIEHSPDSARIPVALVDLHVDAVRAIVREYARPDIAEIATALTRKLQQVTEDFLVHENRHRPGYMAEIASPPLAPGF